jgi:hypothetical protein
MARITLAALTLALVGTQADAQAQEFYVDQLWKEMGRHGGPKFEGGVAAQTMINEQDCVCDRVNVMFGEGQSPAGRAAWVDCGEGRHYRVELWADKQRHTVHPSVDLRG